MASPKDVVLEQFQLGQKLIEMMTADLDDAEYFKAAIDGTNHIGWILCHIACSEDTSVPPIMGASPRIAQSTHDLVKSGSPCITDASKYPPRKEIDELFRNTRAATIEALAAFDEGRWADPSPDSLPKEFFPTLGSLWAMHATHQFWHIGHITVCRVAMGKKPVLM